MGAANDDGVIDADDFALLLVGQQSGTTRWQDGNFNYDTKINADDWMEVALGVAYSAGRDFNNVFSIAQLSSDTQADDLVTSYPSLF